DLTSTLTPDNDLNNDDNGPLDGNIVASGVITLTSGGEPTNDGDPDPTSNLSLDFGFFRAVSVGDLVFEDFADNGVFDPATDTPLISATVSLFTADGVTPVTDLSGATVLSVTTGLDGRYLFSNLRPGVYVVQVLAPVGYESSTDITTTLLPNSDLNGDDNGVGVGQLVATRPITVTSGDEPTNDGDSDPTSNLSVDFGFYRPATLGDLVWLDKNRDGLQDADEPGVPGVTVSLMRPGLDGVPGTADDQLVATTTTGALGNYTFGRLPIGPYFIHVALPLGYHHTLMGTGSASDSDADPVTGNSSVTTLDPSENDPTWDAGLIYSAGLGNRVWLDRDANGIQDPGEVGVANVLVTLTDGAGVSLATQTTDAQGFYAFTYLAPGDYRLSFTLPDGYRFSLRVTGINHDAYSDADPVTGRTALITLGLEEADPTWDAGLYQPVSVGDLVWADTNNNGRVDPTESGLPDVTVSLFTDTNADGQPDATTPLSTTTTASDGRYSFTQLVPGRYLVEVTLPISYTSSTGTPGDTTGAYEPAPSPDTNLDHDDNGSNAAGRVRSSVITLWSQAEPATAEDGDGVNGNLSLDFGLFQPAALGSNVWYDRDGNGRQETGEPGVPDVKVAVLYPDGTPLRNTAGQPITDTTDANGQYLLDYLVPGDYLVGFSNLPAGYTFTTPDVGDEAGDSDVNPLTSQSTPVTLVAGGRNLTIWAGLVNPTAVALMSFTAEARADSVTLRWATAAEWDTWGFHLFRSADGTRANATQLTAQPILGRGGPQLGATYVWEDLTAVPGVAYSYWLQEIELDGGTREYGPATATVQTTGSFRAFLPLVLR
ncbi:MAG: SdrD B-like domain-containing protein, partial [Chloroflexales bacterium]